MLLFTFTALVEKKQNLSILLYHDRYKIISSLDHYE